MSISTYEVFLLEPPRLMAEETTPTKARIALELVLSGFDSHVFHLRTEFQTPILARIGSPNVRTPP